MRRRDVLFGAVAILVIWQMAALIVNEPILPGPIEVARAFFEELRGDLAQHFLVSAWRVVASVLLAVALAAPAGMILGPERAFESSVFATGVFALSHSKSRFGSCNLITLWNWRFPQDHHHLPHPFFPDPGFGAR